MGRKVSFKIEGSLLESEIVKVDRTKLYGTSEKIVYDTNKEECVLSDLYEGSIILPRGSVGQVLIDENGNSVSRSELIGFNLQGRIGMFQESISSDEIREFLGDVLYDIYQLK